MSKSKKEEIISDLAYKYKKDEKEVERAIDAQFKFLKKYMEDDRLPNIRLPFFGVFKPSKKKLKYIKQHNDKNKNSKSE